MTARIDHERDMLALQARDYRTVTTPPLEVEYTHLTSTAERTAADKVMAREHRQLELRIALGLTIFTAVSIAAFVLTA